MKVSRQTLFALIAADIAYNQRDLRKLEERSDKLSDNGQLFEKRIDSKKSEIERLKDLRDKCEKSGLDSFDLDELNLKVQSKYIVKVAELTNSIISNSELREMYLEDKIVKLEEEFSDYCDEQKKYNVGDAEWEKLNKKQLKTKSLIEYYFISGVNREKILCKTQKIQSSFLMRKSKKQVLLKEKHDLFLEEVNDRMQFFTEVLNNYTEHMSSNKSRPYEENLEKESKNPMVEVILLKDILNKYSDGKKFFIWGVKAKQTLDKFLYNFKSKEIVENEYLKQFISGNQPTEKAPIDTSNFVITFPKIDNSDAIYDDSVELPTIKFPGGPNR